MCFWKQNIPILRRIFFYLYRTFLKYVYRGLVSALNENAEFSQIPDPRWSHSDQWPTQYLTKEVNPSLAKSPLNFNGSLAKLGSTFLVK